MKPLMIPISVICYLIFFSCEPSESSEYFTDTTPVQQEQVDSEEVEQSSTEPTEEETTEETETSDPEPETSDPEPETSDPDPDEMTDTEECQTDGGLAGDSGLKTWCWEDITLPNYTGSKGVSFSNNELVIDSECYEQQVTKSGDKIRFRVNPLGPEVGSWCSNNFNMRAEIRTAPWQVRNPLGTEEWYGWSYTFGESYQIDQHNQWKFFQVYPGPVGLGPQISLEVIHGDQFNGHSAGEIYVVNKAGQGSTKYAPTGITPQAGQTLNVVVHVIWGYASEGLLQVWINDDVVYDEEIATVTSDSPWGGNAKWGIYKWPWKENDRVQRSIDQGITYLETYLGPLRIITRHQGDENYGSDSYSQVRPN